MVIARKILVPTLAFFAILLAAVLIYFIFSQVRSLQTQEKLRLEELSLDLDQEFSRMGELSTMLAQQSASNQEVQSAFAEGDRARLSELTETVYRNLKDEYQISQFQFTLPPAKVFLRALEPQVFSNDLSAYRNSVLTANSEEREVSGLEIGEDGLAARGIVPVVHEGKFIGSAEYGIHVNDKTLEMFKTNHGSDWSLMLDRQSLRTAGYTDDTGLTPGPLPNLVLESTTLAEPLFAPARVYQQALEGQSKISFVNENGQRMAVLTAPVRDFSGNVVGVMDILIDRSGALAEMRNRILFVGFLSILGLVLAGFIISAIVGNTLRPVKTLTENATTIAQGNLSQEIILPKRGFGRSTRASQDEVEQLALSLNSMTEQMRILVSTLEQKVAERTDTLEKRSLQLQAVSEIGRDLIVITNLDNLLVVAVSAIRERFDYYQVRLFLKDEPGESFVLRAATDETGHKMIERGYKLRVGEVSETTGLKSSLELDLPLKIGPQMIGVLAVQGQEPGALEDNDIRILQVLADQLAVTINNARLFDQLNRTVNELERTYATYTQSSWQEFLRRRQGAAGYSYFSQPGREQGEIGLSPVGPFGEQIDASLNPEALEALQSGQTVTRESISAAAKSSDNLTDMAETEEELSALAVPIHLREQVMGVLNLRFKTPTIAPEMVLMVEEIASRLGPVLESTRLLREAQRLAWREQQINVITSQVRNSVNLENILQNTVRELGRSLGASRAFIQIGGEMSGLESQESVSPAQEAELPGGPLDIEEDDRTAGGSNGRASSQDLFGHLEDQL